MRRFKQSWCTRSGSGVPLDFATLPITLFNRIAPALEGRIFSKTGNQATYHPRPIRIFLLIYCGPTTGRSFAMTCASQGFKGLLPRLRGKWAEGQERSFWSFLSVRYEHFRKNHLPNLAKQLALVFSALHLSGGVWWGIESKKVRFGEENEDFSKQLMKRPCGLWELGLWWPATSRWRKTPPWFKAKKAVRFPS